jgi:hypothetical protein
MFVLFDDEWNVIRWVLCPHWVRNISRGKPSISLMFGQKKKWNHKWFHRHCWFLNRQRQGLRRWFLSRQRLNFHQQFWCQQWISFRCRIVMSATKQCSLSNCGVNFCCRIAVSATNQFSLPNCGCCVVKSHEDVVLWGSVFSFMRMLCCEITWGSYERKY